MYIYVKYVLRGKIVVFDRYYFDFITDSKRSNIKLNRSFIKILYFFILKPKVNILLWADPLVIYQRKKELEPKVLYELTTNYKSLFKEYDLHYKNSTYRCIENIDIDSTVSKIMEEFSHVA